VSAFDSLRTTFRQSKTLAERAIRRPELYRALFILCCALISLALAYPGRLGPDASWQLQQAISGHYNDWHPPTMAALWRLLLSFGDGAAPMLLVQVGLYWLGVWAVLDATRDRGLSRQLLVLAPALHPLLLVLLKPVLSDVGMATAFFAAFGLIYRARQLGRPLHPLLCAAAAMLIAYGTLVRQNAVFAVPPLLLYWIAPTWLSARRLIPVAAIIVALAIPLSDFINHHVFRAERSHVEVTLELYDLVGIAQYSGGVHGLKAPEGCYNSYFWDTLKEPSCRHVADEFRKRSGSGYLLDDLTQIDAPGVTKSWISAISRSPIAYVRHRISHFNSSTYFLVEPARQCRFESNPAACDGPRATLLLMDFVKKNALYWPCLWLAAGLWLVTRRDAQPGSRALAWSGLMYGLGFLFVGVATDYRYYHWPVLAIGVGVGLHLAQTSDLRRSVRSLAVPVLLVATPGYAARLFFVLTGA
jgi:hypothetical protein